MEKTMNYQLNQWEPSDPIRRADFNSDNAAIDAALAANARALSDYQTANDAAVAKKAEQSTLTALEQSTNTALTALNTALGSGGKTCRITSGSYEGTGAYGKDNPCSLTFDIKPLAVWITGNDGSVPPAVLIRECTEAGSMQVSTGLLVPASINITWDDDGVSWYSSGSASAQCSARGTYYYIAVGE